MAFSWQVATVIASGVLEFSQENIFRIILNSSHKNASSAMHT